MQNIEQDKGKAIDRRQGEEGFSLVGILILSGAVLAGLLYMSKAQLNVRYAAKSLESATSYELFLSSFTDFLQTSVMTQINQICIGNAAALNTLTFLGGNVSSTNTEISSPKFSAISGGRCGVPVYGANGQLHFCLKFDQNTTFLKDSFAGAEYNYAEIAINMVDSWQKAMTCASFNAAAPGTAGMQIFYRLYWVTKTQPGKLFQKQGYFYATRP